MAFVVAFVLFVAGLYLMGLAFTLASFQGFVFFAGIALVSLAVALPVHILKKA
ncbi:hypothetical protein [Okibacterium endophyticum]